MLGMEMTVGAVSRNGPVNIRERNVNVPFLAGLNHFFHLHRINREPVLCGQCIDHLERERPDPLCLQINRPATPPHFCAVLLNRDELGILL